tara:strand:- start:4807 stop:10965 length:6159 start_codon:yes stop_codon:yes gene_type:complete
MPEIKHTFTAGKMNKDLDERLVPNGEFRNAENVQVRTSDTNAIGTVQNIKGTLEVGSSYYEAWMVNNPPKAIASISDEKNDKAYFFFSSPPVSSFLDTDLDTIGNSVVTGERVFIDSIIEQSVNGTTTPVVVDKHTILNLRAEVLDETLGDTLNFPVGWTSFQVLDASKYRVDMTIKALAPEPNNPEQLVDLFVQYVTQGGTITSTQNGNGAKIKAIDLNTNIITLYEEQTTDLSLCTLFAFEAEPVLNFQGNQITGINVIDDLLFWTDNLTEPKKINIARCKEGTVDNATHTKLFVKHPLMAGGTEEETYVQIDSLNPGLQTHPINVDLKEEHLTVLRSAPRTAPTLEMSKTLRSGGVSAEFDWEFYSSGGGGIQLPEDGDELYINGDAFGQTDFKIGDRLDITQIDGIIEGGGFVVTFISYADFDEELQVFVTDGIEEATSWILVEIDKVSEPIASGVQQWKILLKQKKPLFELKLPRFGYRYKYEDGEYSAFSPWSELAFLPGEFDMVVKKAYNLGMVNTIRELIIKDFIPYNKPIDVSCVDILYKEASKPNVYIVKSIKRTKDDDWEINTPSFVNPDEIKTGRLNVTSEMIHRVLPSTQTLRAWDNVPRYALAQEITANRLVYGNYTQGYPFNTPVSLTQTLKSENTPTLENPQKSVKSIRNYKWGMVFGDKYGRETPVIEAGHTDSDNEQLESMSGDVVVEKRNSSTRNFFIVQQGWNSVSVPNGVPPSWADYVKYYVKETSNEYYNAVMDRWYWADEEKENVWISFNSADRNKFTEETYLLLKNQHGNHNPIEDIARFRIIAIEPDAPDFIKTVRRKIGKVEIFPSNTTKHGEVDGTGTNVPTVFGVGDVWGTSIPTAAPVPLMTGTTCQIYMKDWNAFISGWAEVEGTSNPTEYAVQDFSSSIFGRRIDGNIKFRIIGDNGVEQIYSSYRSLYHYRFVEKPESPPDVNTSGPVGADDSPGGDYEYWQQKIELNWDSVWNDEAFMSQRFLDAYGTNEDLKMYFEFIEDHIDHRPQFDGKFFVKLERNLVLESNILYSDGSGGVYFNTSGMGFKLNGPIPFLGDCSANVFTRDYWNDWTYLAWGSGVSGPTPFIDKTQPFFAHFPATPNGGVDPEGTDWTTGPVTYGYNQEIFEGGFQSGTLTNGDMGRFYISKQEINIEGDFAYVDEDNDGESDLTALGDPTGSAQGMNNMFSALNTAVNTFFEKMRTVGTKFRFGNDYDKIFEIIDAESARGDLSGTASPARNYGGHVETPGSFANANLVDTVENSPPGPDSLCVPCNANDMGNGACFRSMIRVDFRRMDIDSGAPIMDKGFDPAVLDPLAGLSSGGLGNIYIVEESDIYGSPGIKAELGGCFETEPKDDVDIDLYYEASNAIPMRLTDKNSFDFAPINSAVSIRRPVTQTDPVTGEESTSNQDIFLTNTNHKVNNIEFTNDTPLVYITSENESGQEVPHSFDIAANDTIVFTLPDGTQTTSTIIEPYTPVATPVTSSIAFVPSTLLYLELIYEFNSNIVVVNSGDYSALTPGMSIQSTGDSSGVIPNGTTVAGIILPNSPGTDGTMSFSNNPNSWDWSVIGAPPFTYPVLITVLVSNQDGYYEIDSDVWKYKVKLAWHNCWAYGNGVESDRVRDDYNASQLDNGVRVSTTFSGYGEEKKSSGLIHSGLYNSISEVNDLNEFNMGEKIQKDLNPSYGSIQALKTRTGDIVVLAEDKIIKVLASKDAVFNADGNPQLIATNRTLGQATPFSGDYGISKNPESLASDQYRLYFTDKQRGAVLRLSKDGLTPISNVGMKSWFRENLKLSKNAIGSFDSVNGEYNVTIEYFEGVSDYEQEPIDSTGTSIDNWAPDGSRGPKAKTVSFNEGAKGWISFKSFIPQSALSVSGKYIAARHNKIWEHYAEVDNNGDAVPYSNFYGNQFEARFTVVFNDMPGVVKHFNTINYEGSQSFVQQNTTDSEYYNIESKEGWYVNSFKTDLQSGSVGEFIDKENKWFNKIQGESTTLANVDTSEFTVQGIGFANVIGGDYSAPGFWLVVQDTQDPVSDTTNFNSPTSTD